MTAPSAIVGDPSIHKAFLDSHVPFLREFSELQKLANRVWVTALQRYNQPLETEPQEEEVAKLSGLRLAQIIVFYLARASFDGLYDVFILVGNGRGFAAKMMLRVMYEHLVTASFIAANPEEAKRFDNHASIEKWKLWTRTLKVLPQVEDTVPAEEIAKLDQLQQQARTQLKSEICNKCGQPKTQAAWTRVAVDTMAEQVDTATGSSLANLYAPCYLMPTALMHPTPFGLESRLESTETDLIYKELPEHEGHDALLRGHGIALRLLKLMNCYFDLGFDTELDARWEAFPKIWGGALVDPPPVPEQEPQKDGSES
jgi:hypothetical protein